MNASREMPRYRSHKEVWALKISKIELLPNPDPAGETASASYGAIITPADEGYGPFEVTPAYMVKHDPEEGGYYVVYPDGYKSYSPAKAFEEGHTLIK